MRLHSHSRFGQNLIIQQITNRQQILRETPFGKQTLDYLHYETICGRCGASVTFDLSQGLSKWQVSQ